MQCMAQIDVFADEDRADFAALEAYVGSFFEASDASCPLKEPVPKSSPPRQNEQTSEVSLEAAPSNQVEKDEVVRLARKRNQRSTAKADELERKAQKVVQPAKAAKSAKPEPEKPQRPRHKRVRPDF